MLGSELLVLLHPRRQLRGVVEPKEVEVQMEVEMQVEVKVQVGVEMQVDM